MVMTDGDVRSFCVAGLLVGRVGRTSTAVGKPAGLRDGMRSPKRFPAQGVPQRERGIAQRNVLPKTPQEAGEVELQHRVVSGNAGIEELQGIRVLPQEVRVVMIQVDDRLVCLHDGLELDPLIGSEVQVSPWKFQLLQGTGTIAETLQNGSEREWTHCPRVDDQNLQVIERIPCYQSLGEGNIKLGNGYLQTVQLAKEIIVIDGFYAWQDVFAVDRNAVYIRQT